MKKKTYFLVFSIVSILLLFGDLSFAAESNLLTNPGFESGISSWFGDVCKIAKNTSQKHSGARSVYVSNRSMISSGPAQWITTKVTNGGTYYVEAWVKSASSGTSYAKICIRVKAVTTDYYYTPETAFTSSQWTKVSGYITLNWAGTLQDVKIRVQTNNTKSLYADDFALQSEHQQPPMHTISGRVYHQDSGYGVANAYVDGFSTYTQDGDGKAAYIAEAKTASDGTYTLTIQSQNSLINNSQGSWITLRVHSAEYRQYYFKMSFSVLNGTPVIYDIPMHRMGVMPNPVVNYGLRESYYGLTRPYFGKGTPKTFKYPSADATAAIVNSWTDMAHGASMHVVIVTQTETSSFQGETVPDPGVEGKTYCLWRKDSETRQFPDDHNRYFENLKDRDGTPMSTSQIDIDAILTKYDQWESGTFFIIFTSQLHVYSAFWILLL